MPAASSVTLALAIDTEARRRAMTEWIVQVVHDPHRAKINPDDVIVNMVDPGLTKGTGLGGHHEMGGVAGALAGAFFAICGRPVDRGAASYTNAVYGHGKESHGCFLMSCEIAP